MNSFEQLTENDLKAIEGGVIPIVVWGLWTSAVGAGFAGGIAVGLNRVNRTKK